MISLELNEDLTDFKKQLKDAHVQWIYMIHVLVTVERNRVRYIKEDTPILFGLGIFFSLA